VANTVTFDLFARDRASGAFLKVGESAKRAGRDVDGLGTRMGGLSGHFAAVSRVGPRGFGLIATGAKAAGLALGAAAVSAGAFGLKTASNMEQARISFTTMLGSAQKADSFLRQLQKFAAATPFAFPELQTAASSLISVGIKADKVIPIMKTLGDVTSGMGTGSEGVQRATVALQQMSAAGKITGEDLNQLRDAGIPVFDLLAAATGRTKAQVAALAQAGKLGGKDLAQLMKALETGKGLERFSGLMEKQSHSLAGLFSTLKDNVSMSLANLVAPAIPTIKVGLEWLTNATAAIGPKIQAGFHLAAVGVRALIGAFHEGDVTSTGFVGVMERVGVAVRAVSGFVSAEVLPRLRAFGGMLQSDVLPGLRAAGGYVMTNFVPAMRSIGGFISSEVLPRVRAFGGFLSGTVFPALARVGGFLATTFTPTFRTVGQTVQKNVVPPLLQLWAVIQRNMPAIQAFAKAVGVVIVVVAALAAKILGILLPILVRLAGFLIGSLIKFIAQTIQYFGALVRAVQATWKGFQTFLAIVSRVWSVFAAVARGAIASVVRVFLGMVGTVLNGAAKAFGWVPGLGGKLRAAAANFNTFRDQVNRSLAGVKSRKVTVSATLTAGAASIRGGGVIARATGGPVFGPGTATSDSILAMLSTGEHVLTAREVKGFGGHTAVMQMRKQAAAQAVGFAAGGPVGLQVSPQLSGMAKFERAIANFNARLDAAARRLAILSGSGPSSPGLNGAVAFARSQAGKPYVWGSAGPGGFDCSGFVSALVNVVQGRNPYSRRFSTGTLPAGLFAPGSGAFNIGWFTGNPGHVAATVNGVPMESRGGDGVVVGSRSRGAGYSYFTHHGHLKGFAAGGPVLPGDPPFDFLDPRGRYYRPGLMDALQGHTAMARGGTITEPVLGIGRSGRSYSFGENGPETVTPGVGGGRDVHVHFHGPVYGASSRELVRELRPALRDALRAEGKVAAARNI
jgi:tape measure domain-containing protein